MTHSNTNPQSGQYLTHALSHVTRAMAAMDSCFGLISIFLHKFTDTPIHLSVYVCRGITAVWLSANCSLKSCVGRGQLHFVPGFAYSGKR